jgi:hypothetical protein
MDKAERDAAARHLAAMKVAAGYPGTERPGAIYGVGASTQRHWESDAWGQFERRKGPARSRGRYSPYVRVVTRA